MTDSARRHRRIVALAVSSILLGASAGASAFCRTRSCETSDSCELQDGCPVVGAVAYWPSACLTYVVQNSGSPKLGLDAAAVDALIAQEFGRWSQADCSDGWPPLFNAQSRGAVECHQVEYNCAHDNVNVVMFEDQDWPYEPSRVAITFVTMNTRTGEILNADMEVNTAQYDFHLDAPPLVSGSWDLRAVFAHELGHFLGLTHSDDELALMRDGGQPTPDLTPDDVAGVCAIYPSGNAELVCSQPSSAQGAVCHGNRDSCPKEAEESGCSCTQPQAKSPWTAWPLALLVLAVARRRAKHFHAAGAHKRRG